MSDYITYSKFPTLTFKWTKCSKDDPNHIQFGFKLQQRMECLFVRKDETCSGVTYEYRDVELKELPFEPVDELKETFKGSYRNEQGNLVVPPL
jgi:hypothetical protein